MDFKEIKRLIGLVETANISHFSIEEDGVKIQVKKEFSGVAQTTSVVLPQVAPVAAPVVAAAPALESPDEGLVEVTAQMVGTYYEAANPESAPFVKVGDSIKNGDIICIIEAMKLFNEIEAEVEGTVEKVCVKTGDAIEYGQVLMLVRP